MEHMWKQYQIIEVLSTGKKIFKRNTLSNYLLRYCNEKASIARIHQNFLRIAFTQDLVFFSSENLITISKIVLKHQTVIQNII